MWEGQTGCGGLNLFTARLAKLKEKVQFTLSNYNKNLMFQIKNRITENIQLSKSGKFGP